MADVPNPGTLDSETLRQSFFRWWENPAHNQPEGAEYWFNVGSMLVAMLNDHGRPATPAEARGMTEEVADALMDPETGDPTLPRDLIRGIAMYHIVQALGNNSLGNGFVAAMFEDETEPREPTPNE